MAIKGKGTTLFYGNSGTTNATAVTNAITRVRTITPPKAEVPDIEISVLSSTSAEYTAGLLDNGEATYIVEVDKTQHDTLEGLVGTDKSWKILYFDGSSHVFEGYLKSAQVLEVSNSDVLTSELVVKVNGALYFNPAT